VIVQSVSLLSLCHTLLSCKFSAFAKRFRISEMHFRSSGNLCYLCHFFTLQPTSRCQLSTALFCHPGLPELLVDAQERLSAPPGGVKLLTWPFTSPEIAPSAVTTGALQSLSPMAAAISRSMGAAPPAATKSLGRSSRRNPAEMPKAQTAKSARRAATRVTLCVKPKWNHVASFCELLARVRCVLFPKA
jgi:hypothetical protein